MNHVSKLFMNYVSTCIILLIFLVQHTYTVNLLGDSMSVEKQFIVCY